jgi:hypothetical protein
LFISKFLEMIIRGFLKQFPDEKNCKVHFKSERDKQGVKCQYQEHYWFSTRERYPCKNFKHKTPFRGGALLHETRNFHTIIGTAL